MPTLTDEEIRDDIRAQFEWDSRTERAHIDIAVQSGVVTLSGVVSSFAVKEGAYEDALAVPGVLSVVDRMVISYAEDHQTSDKEVSSNVESVLRWNPDIEENRVRVFVERGHAMLYGETDAFWKKYIAEKSIRSVRGVTEVLNRLSVIPRTHVEDSSISNLILAALDRSALIDLDDLEIRVRNGRVWLSGYVPSWSLREVVFNAAAYTPGVTDVIDRLSVNG